MRTSFPKLAALSLILVLLIPLAAPVIPLLGRPVTIAASAENTTTTSAEGNVTVAVNTTTNATVPPGLLKAFEVLRANIERLVARLQALNITIPENLTREIQVILSINVTTLTAQQLHDYVVKAAKTIRELARLLAENTSIEIGKLIEKRRLEILFRMMLRHQHMAGLEIRQEIASLVEQAREALMKGNITAAKQALDRAWALIASSKAEKAAKAIIARITEHGHIAVDKATKILEALSAMAARITSRIPMPMVAANMTATVDTLALVVEARMLGGNNTNITSLVAKAIDAARQAINETKTLIENVTNVSLRVVEKAREMLGKAERLVSIAEQLLEQGKTVEALVRARIALMLATIAERMLTKGEPIGIPWMPEPIKPWMPGIPGIPGKPGKPLLPPQWFEARITALNATIVKLEEIAVNKSRQDLVKLLEDAKAKLAEAIAKYNEGEIGIAMKLYMEAYRVVVVVARQLGAEDLLPVYILQVIRPVMIIKHWLHWKIGNLTKALAEIEAEIASLKAKIAVLENTSQLGFIAKQTLAMAKRMLDRATTLLEDAKKLAEKNKQLAAKLLERAKQLIKAVERLIEKIMEKLGGQQEEGGQASSSSGSGGSGGSSGGSSGSGGSESSSGSGGGSGGSQGGSSGGSSGGHSGSGHGGH